MVDGIWLDATNANQKEALRTTAQQSRVVSVIDVDMMLTKRTM